MCDPLSIAGAALTIGSTLMSSLAANKAEKARTSAIVAEGNRQDQLQRQAIGQLNQTTKQFTPEKQNAGIEAAAQERIKRLTDNTTGGGDVNTLVNNGGFAQGGPKVIKEAAAKSLNEGLTKGKDFARRLGRLGAFGENQFGNNVSLGRLGEGLNMLGTESRNSAALLPYELDNANHAGDTLGGIGDILGAVGSVANYGSAYGAGNKLIPTTGSTIIPDILRSAPPLPVRKPTFG